MPTSISRLAESLMQGFAATVTQPSYRGFLVPMRLTWHLPRKLGTIPVWRIGRGVPANLFANAYARLVAQYFKENDQWPS